LRDRCQSIIACHEGFNCFSIEELCNRLERLFSDDRPGVILSTIHRAKGLQNRRVMILDYDKLPLKWLGQKSHELGQEWNLKYVALTRAIAVEDFAEVADTSGVEVVEHGGEEARSPGRDRSRRRNLTHTLLDGGANQRG